MKTPKGLRKPIMGATNPGPSNVIILDFPMDSSPATFAERIRTLRRKLNLSQTDLGSQVGVHYTHIARYEAGKSTPSFETLKRLAEFFGVTTDFLMEGSTDETAKSRLTDIELLRSFELVSRLPDDDKITVKKLLDAFLAMHQIRSITNQAS